MEIELITIGDEVLTGHVLNTNTFFISQELTKLGYRVVRHVTFPDERTEMRRGIKEALARGSIVITTGGLGPTVDDLTRGVVCEIFNCDLHFDETIAEDLKKRFGDLSISLEDQATVPDQAEVFLNRVGTAPALIFEKRLILLPGVPNEMRTFFKEDILPYLKTHYPPPRQEEERELHFCQLSESLLDPHLRRLHEEFPDVHVGIYPTPGTNTVRVKGPNPLHVQRFEEALVNAFPTHLLPWPRPEAALHDFFISKKLTLAVAESCTGGQIAEKITAQSGASVYFLGSVVAYANQTKRDLLGVSEKTLEEKGAVSGEVVLEMLAGLFRVTGADYGIAVSGIAGPLGGTPEKPVGTVWAAIGRKGEAPDVWTYCVTLNREGNMLLATTRILSALYRKVAYGVKGGR